MKCVISFPLPKLRGQSTAHRDPPRPPEMAIFIHLFKSLRSNSVCLHRLLSGLRGDLLNLAVVPGQTLGQ